MTERPFHVSDPDDESEPDEDVGDIELPPEIEAEIAKAADEYGEDFYQALQQFFSERGDIDYAEDEDIGWGDDFNPSQHPRAGAGAPGGKGGQFVKGAGGGGVPKVPDPSPYSGGAGKKVQAMIQQAINEGHDPHDVAKKVQAFAAQYKHHAVAVYTNKALAILAAHHGMLASDLGKAKQGTAVTAKKAPLKTATPPAAVTPTWQGAKVALGMAVPFPILPQPPETNAAKAIYKIAHDPTLSTNAKLTAIYNKTGVNKVESKAYQKEVLKQLEAYAKQQGQMAANAFPPAAYQPSAGKEAPQPESGNNVQRTLHTIAIDPGLSHSEKLVQLNAFTAVTPTTVAYKQALIAHLSGLPKPTPPPAAPAAPPTPAPTAIPPPHAGSKYQMAIHAAATDPATSLAEKEAAISSQMVGTYSIEYGNQVKKALGIAPTPPPAPAAPTPKTPPPAPATKTKKSFPHFSTQHTNEFEDAFGNEVVATLSASTKNIQDNLYQTVSEAYAGDKTNGNTSQVSTAMQAAKDYIFTRFSQAQQTVLTKYKGTYYDPINDYLRGLTTNPSANVKKAVNDMRAALKDSYLPANTPLWRGLHVGLKDLSGFDDPEESVGRCFVHRNFASTSRNRGTAESFASWNWSGHPSVMIHVTVPAGVNAILLGDQLAYEKETVLPDHCVFRIDKVEPHPSEPKKHIVHCTYLGEHKTTAPLKGVSRI